MCHTATKGKGKIFFGQTTPSAKLRWRPTRVWDRITAGKTGWTSWKDFCECVVNSIPKSKQCSALRHPTGTWREWMTWFSQDKARFEVIWFKRDLEQLGIEVPCTQTCIECDAALEATPIGIRAAYGASFYQDLMSSNVSLIPKRTARLLFHKEARFDDSVETIMRDGVWPNAGGRHQICMSGSIPYINCWLDHVNSPSDMCWTCPWSNIY